MASTMNRVRRFTTKQAIEMVYQDGSDEEDSDEDIINDDNIGPRSSSVTGTSTRQDETAREMPGRSIDTDSSDSDASDREYDGDRNSRHSEDLFVSDDDADSDPGHEEHNANEWVKNTTDFPQLPPFHGNSGIKFDAGDDPDAYSIFSRIITDDVIESLMVETNRYARQCIDEKKRLLQERQQPMSPRSIFRLWKPVSAIEMKTFLSICMHMGLVKKAKMYDYWSNHPALHSSYCAKLMHRDRFFAILSFFHVSNNETYIPYGQPNHDPIHKFRNFLDHLNKTFQELYVPTMNVCIYEAVCPFKGCSRFKIYMKDKPTKWGFKFYELCESGTGYVFKSEMYCSEPGVSNKPVDVVMRLMQPLLDQGYRLYVDNYYCCPELADGLLARNTMCCGTVQRNRKGMPKELYVKKQKRGEMDYRRRGQIIVTRWTDKREVNTLSTICKPELRMRQGRFEQKEKPLAVTDYIQHMSGVDHNDQLLSYFPMHRRSIKWWKKPFFHLLTLCVIQSSILLNIVRKSRGQKAIPLYSAAKNILLGLVNNSVEPVVTAAGDGPVADNDRLVGKHFANHIPNSTNKKAAYRNCKVCYDRSLKQGAKPADLKSRRKVTQFWCPKCQVPLCLEPCFEVYHSKKVYNH